jgi:hypothetical protein
MSLVPNAHQNSPRLPQIMDNMVQFTYSNAIFAIPRNTNHGVALHYQKKKSIQTQ